MMKVSSKSNHNSISELRRVFARKKDRWPKTAFRPGHHHDAMTAEKSKKSIHRFTLVQYKRHKRDVVQILMEEPVKVNSAGIEYLVQPWLNTGNIAREVIEHYSPLKVQTF